MTTDETLTRAGLKAALRRRLDLSIEQASSVIEEVLKEMQRAILTCEDLKISSFGTFLIHKKKQRIGRNPKTKQEAIISPRKSVSFRASQKLKALVDRSE